MPPESWIDCADGQPPGDEPYDFIDIPISIDVPISPDAARRMLRIRRLNLQAWGLAAIKAGDADLMDQVADELEALGPEEREIGRG